MGVGFFRFFCIGVVMLCMGAVASAQATQAAPSAVDASSQRSVGAIKAITDKGITLASDGGDEVQVSFQDSTRIVRVAPGEKDLKNATPLQKQDLQVGDRVLVRGKPGADARRSRRCRGRREAGVAAAGSRRIAMISRSGVGR
jgi:hypothetical protein